MGTAKDESPKYGRPFWRALRGIHNLYTPYFFAYKNMPLVLI